MGIGLLYFPLKSKMAYGDPLPKKSKANAEKQGAFGGRLRERAGVLLSPAAGVSHPDVERSRQYLTRVLEKIGLEAMEEKGIHVRVNVYSAHNKNAFAIGPVDHASLGFSADGKPVYEIGFQQGIYPLFKSEDEVAFVLAHELGHILRGDTHPGNSIENHWHQSQGVELDTDAKGLSLMRGKYDLDAAYDVMERLLVTNHAYSNALISGTSSHHHPSLRLAAILALIQQHRRSVDDGGPISRTPIPKDSLQAKGHSRVQYKSLRDPENEVLEGIWESGRRNGMRINPEDADTLFIKAINQIERASIKPAEKLARLTGLIRIFEETVQLNVPTQKTVIDGLSDASLDHYFKAFRALATQNKKWTSKEVVAQFMRYMNEDTTRSLLSALSHPRFKNFFDNLSTASPRFQATRQSLIEEVLSTPRDAKKLIRFMSDKTPPLSKEVERLVVQQLQRLRFDQQELSSEFGTDIEPEEIEKDTSKNPTLREESLRLIDRHNSAAEKARERALLSLRDELKISFSKKPTPAAVNQVVEKIMDYRRNTFDFSNEERPDLFPEPVKKAWLWIQTGYSHYPTLSHNHRSPWRELEKIMTPQVFSDISKGGWTSDEIRLALQHASKTSPRAPEAFLGKMPDRDVLSFLRSLNSGVRSFRENANIIEQLTSILHIDRTQMKSVPIGDLEKVTRQLWSDYENKQMLVYKTHGPETEWEKVRKQKPGENADKKPIQEFFKTTSEWLDSLNLVFAHTGQAERVLSLLSPKDFLTLAQTVSQLKKEAVFLDLAINGPSVHNFSHSEISVGQNLLSHLSKIPEGKLSFSNWLSAYEAIVSYSKNAENQISLEAKHRIMDHFEKNLGHLDADARMKVLSNPKFLGILPPERLAPQVADIYEGIAWRTPNEGRGTAYRELKAALNLSDKQGETARRLDQIVAAKFLVQPNELSSFFPPVKDIAAVDFSSHVRGMSTMLSLVQGKSAREQMQFVDYILGRSSTVPQFIIDQQKGFERLTENRVELTLVDLASSLRSKLLNESHLNRGLAILPFFTGPQGILNSPNGKDLLIQKIVSVLPPGKQDFARALAEGILGAEGVHAPMVMALLFGQKPGNAGSSWTEGEILRALFQAYGVPGVKFGQYLAFTSEFKELREHLGLLQDQAMTLDYLDTVKILQKRYPKGFPSHLEIRGLKGFGSINIAVEIFNHATGEVEIISFEREGVEVSTKEDFRRLRKVFDKLTATPEGKKTYGFALGLDSVIQESVELEFDRQGVFEKQKDLSKIYASKENPHWKIRMVEPHQIENGVIRMQMAQGLPGRVVESENPSLYRSAMKEASEAIVDHLLQKDSAEKYGGLSFYADPDFHNGQVFIDDATKTVWLIDPGQAVKINSSEYETAKMILRTLSGMVDSQKGPAYLSKALGVPISAEDIARLRRSGDVSDSFIKFISMVSRKGGKVPLPSVHWILGINRQLALRKMIGSPLEMRLGQEFIQDDLRASGAPSQCPGGLGGLLGPLLPN